MLAEDVAVREQNLYSIRPRFLRPEMLGHRLFIPDELKSLEVQFGTSFMNYLRKDIEGDPETPNFLLGSSSKK